MEALYRTIDSTPIIDNHAHNLLLPHELEAREFISITTEAADGAVKATPSSLSHIRAVQQLSQILGCEAKWEAVQVAVAKRRQDPEDKWAKECFDGIETVLIDDGLDASTVHDWKWHDRLTKSPCKRIVRIEKVAETIMDGILAKKGTDDWSLELLVDYWPKAFRDAINRACQDPNVVGFKSVICYRTGLDIPRESEISDVGKALMRAGKSERPFRLDDEVLSPSFLLMASKIIKSSGKPLQFHTGLGDNDITLSLSTPSLMQPFIKDHPDLKIVLLHSSYPFTREAGYLASVYENVYLDIGEVFPMVSQDGQENIVRESLELCPSEKLCWSTDGHWFPETYLLAIIQIRQALKTVLHNSVVKQSLTVPQAIKIVEDVLFETSNKLYDLKLKLTPLPRTIAPSTGPGIMSFDVLIFTQFLKKHPEVKFLRTQWLDYTATSRTRILPIDRALALFSANNSIGITKAVLGMLQPDIMVPSFSPVGEYKLIPCFESLRLGERNGYATVQCEFWENDGEEVSICPRSMLRQVVQRGTAEGISLLVGFELEVVFFRSVIDAKTQKTTYLPLQNSGAHCWSATSALRDPDIMTMIEEIVLALHRSEIDLQQWHPESAPGQYEFITGPLPPLAAVDTLMATREIIFAVSAKHGLKATFVPKPFAHAGGTGAHVHISLTPEERHTEFYAGILNLLPQVIAFTYAGKESYDRLADSSWAGGRYVAWGTQNRETPLRKVEGSHWEMKCMDGLSNPYLGLAAVLECGLIGVRSKLEMTWKDCTSDPARLSVADRKALNITEMLPANVTEALDIMKRTFGDMVSWKDACKVYCDIKAAELEWLDKMSDEDRRTFMIEHY